MPSRQLNEHETFETIEKWLGENIVESNSVSGSSLLLRRELKKVFLNRDLNDQKGIYFWFCKHAILNTFEKLSLSNCNLPRQFDKVIDDINYKLVYLGTAGVKTNNEEGNNSNLFDRLNWHLFNSQSEKSVLSGYMSTLRRTLSSLISDDLILNDAQGKLTKTIAENFVIYFVEYGNSKNGLDFAELRNIVLLDESILIKKLKPIFNISQNPDCQKLGTIANFISENRKQVEKKTRKRLLGNSNSTIKDIKNINKPGLNFDQKNTKKKKHSISQFIREGKIKCIEFEVGRKENISVIAAEIKNIPTGPCTVELIYNKREVIRQYINGRIRNIRTNGRTVAEFFNAPDTNYGNIPKYQIIQNEMNEIDGKIENITVRVCQIQGKIQKSSIEEYLEKKLENSNSKLQPIIYEAILNLFRVGLTEITARMVQNECLQINDKFNWGGRLPAICNSMRNAAKINGKIIGEDRDYSEFTIDLKNRSTDQIKTSKPEVIKTNLTQFHKISDNTLNLSKKFKIVLVCSASKNSGGEVVLGNRIINFNAKGNPANYQFKPDDIITMDFKKNFEAFESLSKNINSWRDFVTAVQKLNFIPLKSYELYKKRIYRRLYDKYGSRFFILSAGWGLIKADFRIPLYDITFNGKRGNDNKRIYNRSSYEDYNHIQDYKDNEDIIYVGGKDYLKLFYDLTYKLPNRKIVYFSSQNMNEFLPPNDSFILRKASYKGRNWYIQLAQDLINAKNED